MTSNVEAFVRGLRNATAKRKSTIRTQTVNDNDAKTSEAAEASRANLLASILNHIRKSKEHDNEQQGKQTNYSRHPAPMV